MSLRVNENEKRWLLRWGNFLTIPSIFSHGDWIRSTNQGTGKRPCMQVFSRTCFPKQSPLRYDLQQFSIGCLMDRISIQSVIRSLMIDKTAQLSADLDLSSTKLRG